MTTLSSTGVDAFVLGLERCDREVRLLHGVVTFPVEVLSGVHAGTSVQTGVNTAELRGWPLTPPHWIHLPDEITFARTNTNPSPIPGWLAHSRDVRWWAATDEPAQAWIAHVRGVLGESR